MARVRAGLTRAGGHLRPAVLAAGIVLVPLATEVATAAAPGPLRLTDMPRGWIRSAPTTKEPVCGYTVTDNALRLRSGDFQSVNEVPFVFSTYATFRHGRAQVEMTRFRRAVAKCPPVPAGEPKYAVAKLPAFGDESIGLIARVSVDGAPFAVYSTVTRIGDAITMTTLGDRGTPDAGEAVRLSRRAVQRARGR